MIHKLISSSFNRKEDPAPYPVRPPLTLLANRESSLLRMAAPKTVFVDNSQLLSLLKRTLHLHDSSPFLRFGHNNYFTNKHFSYHSLAA